jgi:hypothetical protein
MPELGKGDAIHLDVTKVTFHYVSESEYSFGPHEQQKAKGTPAVPTDISKILQL